MDDDAKQGNDADREAPPSLTSEEEAEAERLYAEMLEYIAADRDPFVRPDLTPRDHA
jgi:hypothetical protein